MTISAIRQPPDFAKFLRLFPFPFTKAKTKKITIPAKANNVKMTKNDSNVNSPLISFKDGFQYMVVNLRSRTIIP